LSNSSPAPMATQCQEITAPLLIATPETAFHGTQHANDGYRTQPAWAAYQEIMTLPITHSSNTSVL